MSEDSDPRGPLRPQPRWPAPAVGGARGGDGAEAQDRPEEAPTPPPRLGGRLHPAVLVIWPFNQIFPIAVLLVAGNLTGMIALVLLAGSVITGLIRYRRFSWRLEEGSLVIEQGLIQHRRRVIPLERVQSVDLVRKVRHRLFGVVEVRVEAIGGSATEGKLDALAQDEAVRLRAALLAARETGRVTGAAAAALEERSERAEQPAGELVHLRPTRLVLAGLTGGRVGVVAAMLGAAEQLLGNRITQLFSRLPNVLDPTGLIGLALVIAVLAFLLSVLATAVAYWDFRLIREQDQLRVRRGLLEQRVDTVPLRRIQSVRVEENLVRRLLGYAAVKVDIAGKAGGNDARDTGLLLPLGTRAEAHALVAGLLDAPEMGNVRLEPMPIRARDRRLIRAAVVTLVLAAAAGVIAELVGDQVASVSGALGTLALVGVPAVIAALDAYRALGAAHVAGTVIGRAGVLVRRTAYVPIRNLQMLKLTATPFQRRRGLATLGLEIARSPGVWGGPELIDLDRQHGETLLRGLNAVVISDIGGLEPARGAKGPAG